MKGRNTLTINEATLIEAVQFWLDSEVWKDGNDKHVTSVRPSESSQYSRTFVVEIDDKKAETE